MSQKLEIRAFFFNAKTDYLPYYKNFTVTVDDDATAKDLLAKIQEQNENFSYPKQKLIMQINGLVVEAKQSVLSLVERFGTSLQVDPVNSYRSNDGLKINDSDFMESFELLAPYASESPYGLWFMPKRHIRNIREIQQNEKESLARAMTRTLTKLDDLYVS